MGGIPIYSEELADRLLEQLADGDKSLRQICREEGISHSLVLKWAANNPEFRDRYVLAREIGDDAEFERLADEAAEEPRTVKGFVDNGWVQAKRLKIDTMKWSLARRRPMKYGERAISMHTGPDGKSAPTLEVVVRSVIEESK